jgi:hypothetical protein
MARPEQTHPKQASPAGQSAARASVGRTTQSENSLARASGNAPEDGRFSVAEEVNLDQQSDQARHVGQMPEDIPSGGMAAAAQQKPDAGEEPKEELRQSLKRAVPPPPLGSEDP